MSENTGDFIDLVRFVPDNIALEIGRTTIAFSLIEDALNALIAALLGVGPATGQAVTFKIRNITDRIELARSLVNLRLKDFTETLDAITRVEEANKRRNVLIHYALNQITYNLDPAAHEVNFQKKDHYLRKVPISTKMKAAEFKALTDEIRIVALKVESVTQLCKLSLARGGSSP
jgi:hypothetical protein